jgi:hypothetical protein
MRSAAADLLEFAEGRHFTTVLADPPWQFSNRTGKMAPEHRRLSRYRTMKLEEITELPISQLAASPCHLYLWCPNAMLPEGLAVMKAWGFAYKSNIVWHKVRKDGGSDGRVSGSTFAMSLNSCSSESEARMHARLHPDANRSTCLPRASVNTQENLTSNTRSLKRVARVRTWSCLHAVNVSGGRRGAIRQMLRTLRRGRRMPTTRS